MKVRIDGWRDMPEDNGQRKDFRAFVDVTRGDPPLAHIVVGGYGIFILKQELEDALNGKPKE